MVEEKKEDFALTFFVVSEINFEFVQCRFKFIFSTQLLLKPGNQRRIYGTLQVLWEVLL